MAMSSADHRAKADHYLKNAAASEGHDKAEQLNLQRAQVHATLAIALALSENHDDQQEGFHTSKKW
ncbi:hypothetical protein REH65_19345 [Saccharopolyspora sp. ID03-671]|uniref:hypothetical protein n=1 Tax=Saccharopolyspora sp. ID03-671 TaxID=3073066 RepID=UPI003248B6B9